MGKFDLCKAIIIGGPAIIIAVCAHVWGRLGKTSPKRSVSTGSSRLNRSYPGRREGRYSRQMILHEQRCGSSDEGSVVRISVCLGLGHWDVWGVGERGVCRNTGHVMKNLLLCNKKFGLFLVGKREPPSRFVFWGRWLGWQCGEWGCGGTRRWWRGDRWERMLPSLRRMMSSGSSSSSGWKRGLL